MSRSQELGLLFTWPGQLEVASNFSEDSKALNENKQVQFKNSIYLKYSVASNASLYILPAYFPV